MSIKAWLIVIIATFVMFINLGTNPLLDPDEPVYAQTAQEMIVSGDFISPRIYGEYWYDKPPMYYWLTAISFKLFGINEFSARFPSAFLAVAGALAVYFFCSKLFNVRAAFAAALILTTSVEYFYLGKAAVTDMVLTFCLTVSLLSFITKRYYLFYFFAGLAALTKGPVGFLFPFAIVGIYLIVTRQLHTLLQMKLIKGLILFAVIAFPWYIVMYKLHGNIFIDTFFGFHNITRFTSPEHENNAVLYFFIPVLIVGFFPWIAVLFQSVWTSLIKSDSAQHNTLVFFNIWAAFVFLFFTVSQTKLISYILPLFPAIAILVGWYIDKRWDDYKKSSWVWGTLTLVFLGALIAAAFYGSQKLPELIVGIVPTVVVLTVMAIACLIFGWKGQAGSIFWTKTLAMVVFFVIQMTLTLPAIAPMFTAKYVAQEFLRLYDGQSPLYIAKFLRPGVAFYADVYGKQIPQSPGEPARLEESIAAPGRGVFIVQQRDYDHLSEDAKKTVMVLAKIQDRLILREH